MSFISTVTGRIDPAQLGPTDCHDHLFIRGGMPVLRYPDFRLDDYDKIRADTAEFHVAGGRAIIEMSPIDWGRDAMSMARLSRETGVHIIAATGFHKLFYYSDIHWVYAYREQQIARLIAAEIIEGMDTHEYAGPIVERTDARAGVIKVGTQTDHFSPTEEKLLSAVAAAHHATGAPILTHTDEGALAMEQVDRLIGYGVPANCIGLSHMDRRLDLGLHTELAARGVFLEYDALTRVTKGFDHSTLTLVLGMVEAGHGSQVLLGGDISRQGYWTSYGGAPGLAFLVGEFRRRLAAAGLTAAQIGALYEGNPRAFLTFAELSRDASAAAV
jgi:predicted metal-dependent phosphotriesterase family hydrolase